MKPLNEKVLVNGTAGNKMSTPKDQQEMKESTELRQDGTRCPSVFNADSGSFPTNDVADSSKSVKKAMSLKVIGVLQSSRNKFLSTHLPHG